MIVSEEEHNREETQRKRLNEAHKDKKKGILLLFIRTYQGYLWWYLFILTVFLFVSFLYHELLAPIGYAVLILSFTGVLLSIRGYVRFAKRIREIYFIIGQDHIEPDMLPVPHNVLENCYQEMIRNLIKQQKEILRQEENERIARDDYYTMWVHQIKTPISAMDLLLQDSLGNLSEEKIHQKNVLMRQELFKTEQYAEMVLQYLRMEQMEKDLSIQEIKVKDMVHGVLKKYSSLFIYKKLSLTTEELNRTVYTDEKWCSFLLEQILSNAIKYSAEQGRIEIYSPVEGLLVVKDYGIGIRKEDLPRIFERGFTGYNGRMYKKATGLGLYMCKQIADKLSIRISIESEVSAGTKVMIEFPAKMMEMFS